METNLEVNQTIEIVESNIDIKQHDNCKSKRLKQLLDQSTKIRNKEDEIKDLQKVIDDLNGQNKLLKVHNIKTERELNDISTQNSSIPRLLSTQEVELRSLKDQLRKIRSAHQSEQKNRREAEKEIKNLKQDLKQKNEILSEKDLLERSELNRRLEHNSEVLIQKNQLIRDYECKMELLDKNHKCEISNLKSQIRECMVKFDDMQTQYYKIKDTLQEKEKIFQIQNIYLNRNSYLKYKNGSNNNKICENCAYTCIKENNKISTIEHGSFLNNVNLTNSNTKNQEIVEKRENEFLNNLRQFVRNEIRNIRINQINDKNESIPPKLMLTSPTNIIESPKIDIDLNELDNESNQFIVQTEKNNSITSDSIIEDKPIEKNTNIPPKVIKKNGDDREDESKVCNKTISIIKKVDSIKTHTKSVNFQETNFSDNDDTFFDIDKLDIFNENKNKINKNNLNKKSKLINNNDGVVLNNNDSLYYRPEKYFKFPQVIKEDFKDLRGIFRKTKDVLSTQICRGNLNKSDKLVRIAINKKSPDNDKL